MRSGMNREPTDTLEGAIREWAQVILDLNRQLATAQADNFKLQQHHEEAIYALQLELSSTSERLQQQNQRLKLYSEGVWELNKDLKEQVADLQSQLQEVKEANRQQKQAHDLQMAKSNQVVADLQVTLAAVPSMERKIELLTEELAVVQGECDELQHLRVQDAVTQEVHEKLAEKEKEVAALNSSVACLQRENLELRNELQFALDGNQQLQEQAVDLPSQLQQVQETVTTNLQELQAQQQQQMGENDEVVDTAAQEQLEPPHMVRASSDPADAPGTPDLVAGSFTEIDSRVLQPNPDARSSSSRRCSSAGHAITGQPRSRGGKRGLRVGQVVLSAAAAGVLIMLRLRRART